MELKAYFEKAIKAILGVSVVVGDVPDANIVVMADAGLVQIVLKQPYSGNFNVLGFFRDLTDYIERNDDPVVETVVSVSFMCEMPGPAAPVEESAEEAPAPPVDDMHTQDPAPAAPAESESDIDEPAEEPAPGDEDDDKDDEEE